MSSDLAIQGPLALEFVRAAVASLAPEAKVELLRGLLTPEERAAIWRDIVFQHGAVSVEDAAQLTPWTPSGFLRVANRENCPWIKGPHKAPRAYVAADVAAMLQRMKVWPEGQPLKRVA